MATNTVTTVGQKDMEKVKRVYVCRTSVHYGIIRNGCAVPGRGCGQRVVYREESVEVTKRDRGYGRSESEIYRLAFPRQNF